MDEEDIGYDDFVDKKQKGMRKPPVRILILVLIILLLGAGGYFVWSRPELLSFLAQLRPAAGEEAETTPISEEPGATEVAGFAITESPETTPTALTPTEAPVEPDAESILPAPAFGWLVQNVGSDKEERAVQLAIDMAVREPYQWEYLEFDETTLVRDVERYYIQLLNKDMGYLMTFNDRYPGNALAIFKFKQDGRRVIISFYEGHKDRIPAAYIHYEGW